MTTKSKIRPIVEMATPAAGDPPAEVAEADTSASRRPRIIVPVGRGTRGKTWLSEYLIATALNTGRPLLVGDGDRQNQSLAARFAGVRTPPSADESEMRGWIAGFIEAVIVSGETDALLDLGAGDLALRRTAKEQELLPWLDDMGVDLVVVHLLGASVEDLAHVAAVEEAGLAAPMTVLILNEGTVPANRDPAAAFAATIGAHPILAATVARGARLVRLPRLDCAPEMEERGLGLAHALAGRVPDGVAPLGPWAAQQLALWRRRTQIALAPVSDWLL
ncbi:hypothetical protein [Methylobacterium sp. WL6]|uniref:hypothetical protein n=1 Tax=Methylobacterium sp. WL6 TaxID=2603901 RepID=UPI0011CA4D72|nr:hypothetical protein [Methylobacterium sp. WL6]TXN64894.1 hypothetical protein FV230_17750 [Methylobacterium sp. WL6]